MGLLTPIAVRLGKTTWMPKLLPQVVWLDKQIARATRGRFTVLDIAGSTSPFTHDVELSDSSPLAAGGPATRCPPVGFVEGREEPSCSRIQVDGHADNPWCHPAGVVRSVSRGSASSLPQALRMSAAASPTRNARWIVERVA
jgi:hypothetical protein